MTKKRKTTVGEIHEDVLQFTAGRDVELDKALIEVDCIGTAAHVTMLSRMPVKPPLISKSERLDVISKLIDIIKLNRNGKFKINIADQDVHLAIEKHLTRTLGDLGKKIHTGRSRNDQVAVDLRLYGKQELLETVSEAAECAKALMKFSIKHVADPMVGRTHMQPAMPSTVGLWAAAHAESLLDDIAVLMSAFELNDQCPLGAAASYGVPLPIDRQLTSDLLGFARPVHTTLYANNARGKNESIILHAMTQVMLTLSRIAQDLMLFTMPEFGYFKLPKEYCTGSSIMPQKQNPDVLELIRSRTSLVMSNMLAVQDIIKAAPTGYNRDLQDAKGAYMDGIATTRASLRVMKLMLKGLKVDRKALLKGFTPGVYATDYALDLVGQGVPFRDAYHHVKSNINELGDIDPYDAISRKTHMGATAGINFELIDRRIAAALDFVKEEKSAFAKAVTKLLGVKYPVKK